MANQLYLQDFEDRLQKELLQICTSYHFLDGVLLSSEDLDKRWNEIAPEYMVDAVANIKEYPMVSVAWAAYLGMAIAHGWDKNWEIESRKSYSTYYGDRGFDDMDENSPKYDTDEYWCEWEKKQKEINAAKDEFFQLFSEYFFALWD